MIRVHAGERILAAHAANGRAERIPVVPTFGHHVRQQHREALRVRFAAGRMSVLLQFETDSHEVLEDAVVDDGDLAVQASVRMSVLLGRSSMRRPTRVTNSDPRRESMAVEAPQFVFEISEAVRCPCDLDGARGVNERNSRAVVPPVFELPKTVQKNRGRFFIA
jgi:hypothetical protein